MFKLLQSIVCQIECFGAEGAKSIYVSPFRLVCLFTFFFFKGEGTRHLVLGGRTVGEHVYLNSNLNRKLANV